MKVFTAIVFLFFSFSLTAQYESKAEADAKRFFPGYSSYEYSHKKQKAVGLRYYYRCNVNAFKSAGFKCYPQAKLKKGLWVEYWTNGELKDKGTWIGKQYIGVPNPNKERLEASLEDSFDPVGFFDAAWLWDLLEIHGYEIEADMTGLREPLWSSETEVMVHGYVTASIIRGCCDVEKYNFTGMFKFTSPDCGKSFKFVDGYQKPTMYNKELLEKKSYSKEEGLALQKKTIGRAAAEGKAKEEWDALVPIEMPDFSHPQEFAAYLYQMITTGTEDEVRSVLYRTLPSYRFMEGSEYLLDWLSQETMEKTVDQIIGNKGVNVQSNYCGIINRYKNAKNSYIFHDKAEESTLEVRITEENGKYKLKELKIWLADGIKDKECPSAVEYEMITNSDFGFSVKMPKGYETKKTDKSIVYEKKINGIKYVFAASNFGEGESNSARERQAKDNVDRHILGIHSTEEKVMDWSMNGVNGKEAFFLAENSKYERYRTVYLGNINYELWIIGLSFTEADDVFFDSFTSDLKGGGSREGLSFKNGDPVEIHIGAGRYEKGNITQVNPDNTYKVYVKTQNKTYTAPVDALRADKNGTATSTTSLSNSSSERPDSYEVGDYVLVRTSATEWEHGKIKADKGNGKYHVVIYEKGEEFIQPIKNLKPDNNPTEKKEKKIKKPNIKLR